MFLSHSSKDKDFVRELYRRLTRDGVSCFFDAESIGWGDNWVRALECAIDECEQIVFVLFARLLQLRIEPGRAAEQNGAKPSALGWEVAFFEGASV